MTIKDKNKIFPKLNIFTNEIQEELQNKIEVKINNIGIYEQAFTHSSYLAVNKILSSNERLEFLGDAILEFIVSKYLFENYLTKPEGELTELRSQLVNKKNLFDVSYELDIQKYLILSYGAEKSCGRDNMSILANAMEALIAAIYLDAGMIFATRFVKKHIILPIIRNSEQKNINYKKKIQELLQEYNKLLPEYKVLEEIGVAHDKTFTIGVFINDKQIGVASGKTKKSAEQLAAAHALVFLKNQTLL